MKNKLLVLGAGAVLLGSGLSYGHEGKRDRDHDGDSSGVGREEGSRDRVPVVPEANTAWVLLPFMGAVLLYGGYRAFGARAGARVQ